MTRLVAAILVVVALAACDSPRADSSPLTCVDDRSAVQVEQWLHADGGLNHLRRGYAVDGGFESELISFENGLPVRRHIITHLGGTDVHEVDEDWDAGGWVLHHARDRPGPAPRLPRDCKIR